MFNSEMQPKSDAQLLREYAESGQESAFDEIVHRHTDLVYSAALRQVDSADLAGDVAQSVFADLARKARLVAGQLPAEATLVGWLYRGTRFEALNVRRGEQRRQFRERQAMEELLPSAETGPDWDRLRPVLDEAMAGLNDADRETLLLRFFKNHDLRTVGMLLGVSDDAAQKRVSRAVERLREFFASRGIAVGAGGLTLALSARAVHAAPAGLAASISTAAVLVGTAVHSSTAIVGTQAIAMTLLQKCLIGATLTAALGTSLYEANHIVRLRRKNQTLEEQQAPLAAQVQQLRRERDEATNRLASLAEENAKLRKGPSEVLKLRGEVGRLRQENSTVAATSALNKITANPETKKLLRDQQKTGMAAIYKEFASRMKLTPEQTDKLNDALADNVMDNVDRVTEALRDSPKPEELRRIFNDQDLAFAEKVKEALGPEASAQYLDYTKNLGSYLTSQQCKGLLAGDNAAKEEKSKQLYQLMQDETQTALSAAGLPQDYQTVPMLNFRNIASEEEGERSLKLLDGIYEQVAARGAAFLSPEELTKFQEYRTAALKNSRTALIINRKMMAPIGN
jgi:RNA polymerase sigma factor (sigma-70 family)